MAKINQRAIASRAAHPQLLQRSAKTEGYSLPVQFTSVPGQPMTASLGVDVSGAPTPDRKYVADAAFLRIRANDVQFIFAQETVMGNDLSSALVVKMGASAALQFLISCDSMANPTIDDIARLQGIEFQMLPELKSNPSQHVVVVANLGSAAVAGGEACIDFYHASPFAMAQAPITNHLQVEPMVRIYLNFEMFYNLLKTAWLMRSQIESKVKV